MASRHAEKQRYQRQRLKARGLVHGRAWVALAAVVGFLGDPKELPEKIYRMSHRIFLLFSQ